MQCIMNFVIRCSSYNKSEKTRYSDTKEMQMMYDIWVQMSEFSRKNA